MATSSECQRGVTRLSGRASCTHGGSATYDDRAKTAGLDAKIAALAVRLEVKIDSAVRFNRGTVWAAVATMAASVLAAGAAVAVAIAFG